MSLGSVLSFELAKQDMTIFVLHNEDLFMLFSTIFNGSCYCNYEWY